MSLRYFAIFRIIILSFNAYTALNIEIYKCMCIYMKCFPFGMVIFDLIINISENIYTYVFNTDSSQVFDGDINFSKFRYFYEDKYTKYNI